MYVCVCVCVCVCARLELRRSCRSVAYVLPTDARPFNKSGAKCKLLTLQGTGHCVKLPQSMSPNGPLHHFELNGKERDDEMMVTRALGSAKLPDTSHRAIVHTRAFTFALSFSLSLSLCSTTVKHKAQFLYVGSLTEASFWRFWLICRLPICF